MAIELHPVRGHVRIRPPAPMDWLTRQLLQGVAAGLLIVSPFLLWLALT